MSYQTRHPEAAVHPLRSIPLLRPMSCLGPAFVAVRRNPAEFARAQAVQVLQNARFDIEWATEAYADARAAIGEVNRMGRKDRHDRALYSDEYVRRRRSAVFGSMNRMRGRLIRAQKALVAAEAALLALAS